MAPIHLCFGGDIPLGYVNNSFAIFSATTALSSKMIQLIQLNRTIIWKDFPNIFLNIWL